MFAHIAVFPMEYNASYFAFELCQSMMLEERRAEGNPESDLHPAPFQHSYTRKSTTTPSGVSSMFAGLPHYGR